MATNTRIKGSADKAKGKVKEMTGKATGKKTAQARGKLEQAKGEVKERLG